MWSALCQVELYASLKSYTKRRCFDCDIHPLLWQSMLSQATYGTKLALMKFVTCGLKKSCWSLEFLRLSIVSQWLLHPVVSHMALPLLQPVLHVTQLLPALWKGDRDAPRGQSTKGRGEDFKRSNFTTRTLSGLYCMCDMEYVMLLCYCSPMPTLVLHIVFAR